jgi:hypothetical protein
MVIASSPFVPPNYILQGNGKSKTHYIMRYAKFPTKFFEKKKTIPTFAAP